MRRCKYSGECIPSFAKSETLWHKKGFSSLDAMVEYGKQAADRVRERLKAKEVREATKARVAQRRAYNAAKRARKEHNQNSIAHQRDLTQAVFNRMIRLLDAGKNCPTCGKMLIDGSYDAGHVRTVAACPEIRMDARNCFGQCRSCNGSGTRRKLTRKTQESVSELYRAWIKATKGQAYYDWLYGPHAAKHYSCDDFRAMRAEFAAECRRLEKGESPSRDWRALCSNPRAREGRDWGG